MKNLICPNCNKATFNPEHVWDGSAKIKCPSCGKWNPTVDWKTVAQLQEENRALKEGLKRIHDRCIDLTPKQAIGEMLAHLLASHGIKL